MKFFKFIFLFLLTTYYLIPNTHPVLAHFVKSDAGIGAVLHVDPGDDPVAREPSNIILEFKDTNNKFDLTNCICKIIVAGTGKEIINQDLEPVAPDQKLSSVTPITFPQKDIYQLKITGSSKDNSYKAFELNYDVRVERESSPAAEPKQENWWSGHIIHLAGGLLIAFFLLFALIKQSFAKS